MFALSPREITDAVESEYGYFVIRLDGQVMERVPPLDTIRDSVIDSVIDQKPAYARVRR